MEEKKKGNFWLTVVAHLLSTNVQYIYVLFFIAIIYSVVSVNKGFGESGYYQISAGGQ